MIISVSRRCDIPRFKFDWFMERINEMFVDTVNPYNAAQTKRIPLVPMKDAMINEKGVDAFVFWTRDPKHILANTDELNRRGFPFYVMVSVTGYPGALEPNQAPVNEVISSIKELSAKIGSDRVIWRYDPVFLTSITDENFHYQNFLSLAKNFCGHVKRVIISFYDEYKTAKKRLLKLEQEGKIKIYDSNSGDYYKIASDFVKIAKNFNIEIQTCAEKENFASLGLKPGACIDAALIKNICTAQTARDKNQRPDCLCCKSVDIGVYGTCAARCVYCYAW